MCATRCNYVLALAIWLGGTVIVGAIVSL